MSGTSSSCDIENPQCVCSVNQVRVSCLFGRCRDEDRFSVVAGRCFQFASNFGVGVMISYRDGHGVVIKDASGGQKP